MRVLTQRTASLPLVSGAGGGCNLTHPGAYTQLGAFTRALCVLTQRVPCVTCVCVVHSRLDLT